MVVWQRCLLFSVTYIVFGQSRYKLYACNVGTIYSKLTSDIRLHIMIMNLKIMRQSIPPSAFYNNLNLISGDVLQCRLDRISLNFDQHARLCLKMLFEINIYRWISTIFTALLASKSLEVRLWFGKHPLLGEFEIIYCLHRDSWLSVALVARRIILA